VGDKRSNGHSVGEKNKTKLNYKNKENIDKRSDKSGAKNNMKDADKHTVSENNEEENIKVCTCFVRIDMGSINLKCVLIFNCLTYMILIIKDKIYTKTMCKQQDKLQYMTSKVLRHDIFQN